MSLIAFASVKGSPGVTTTVLALASVWPTSQHLIVAELDPAGGDLATRFGQSFGARRDQPCWQPLVAPVDQAR